MSNTNSTRFHQDHETRSKTCITPACFMVYSLVEHRGLTLDMLSCVLFLLSCKTPAHALSRGFTLRYAAKQPWSLPHQGCSIWVRSKSQI